MSRVLTIKTAPSPPIKLKGGFWRTVLFSLFMKTAVSFLLLLIFYTSSAQKIQTILPDQSVVVGTAFQVQYIISNPGEAVSSTPPTFDSCRLISGPNIYQGNATIEGRQQSIQNIAYTLMPLKVGTLKIGSIKVYFKNGMEAQSSDTAIRVVPQPNASFLSQSSYTDITLYAPASKTDRQKLIEDNLFIKTEVDKKVCYEGEPVVATFKLYSRLQSSSEAEKSPAFYGFSVVDVLNTNQAHTAVETVNGKVFNTSVLRQVQLYPVQTGQLTIDEMYVQNEIEFDDTLHHTKVKVEKEIVTKPIIVTVKPLPEKKPENFTGAVGSFTIEAHLQKAELPVNQEGKIIIIISGKGNFIQFGQPLIQWPRGTETFDPVLTDQLNKNTVPIEGRRTYEFGFAPNAIGTQVLPPVSFSFFDVTTGSFKTISTDTLYVNVTKAKRSILPDIVAPSKRASYLWILLSILILCIVGVLLYRKKRKQFDHQPREIEARSNYIQQIAALNLNELTDQQTCAAIQKILSAFSKEKAASLSIQQKQELQSILKDCELQIYSHQSTAGKEEIVIKAIKIIETGKA